MLAILGTLRGKLFAAMGIVGAVGIGVGVVGLTRMAAINHSLGHIVEVTSTKQTLANQMAVDLGNIVRYEKYMVLDPTPEGKARWQQGMRAAQASLEEKLKKIEGLADARGQERLRQFQETMKAYEVVAGRIQEATLRDTNAKAFELSTVAGRDLRPAAERAIGAVANGASTEASRLLEGSQDANAAQAAQASQRASLAHECAFLFASMVRMEKNLILERNEEGMRRFEREIQEAKRQIDDRLGRLAAVSPPGDQASLTAFRDAVESWMRSNEQVIKLSVENSGGLASRLTMTESRDAVMAATETLKAISVYADEDMDAEARQTTAMYQTARWTVLGTLLVGLAVGFGVCFAIIRGITASTTKVLATLERVAAGDLTGQPINAAGRDEICQLARATDTTSKTLRDIIGELSGAASEVSSAATEIAASAEEMSASVGEVARQAAQASDAAASSGKAATEGGEVVSQTIDGMRQINDAVKASATSVTELGAMGEQIGEIIGVINDIAEQTNLLALNAAIEAARAGEHGRGFAVVADEVRKLAERTTKATEEVGQRIKAIQSETSVAVDRMSRGTEQVSQGVVLAEKAGGNLKQIVDGAGSVAGMIQAISAASEEAGAGASQSASAATQLSAKANQLMEMVQRFKIDGGGAHARKHV